MVSISFDMTPRYMISHPLAEENTNQAAVTRGPLVYCLEGIDNNQGNLHPLFFDPKASFTATPTEIGGRQMVALTTTGYQSLQEDYDQDALYQPLEDCHFTKTKLALIPYFAWDNREYGELKVWVPIRY